MHHTLCWSRVGIFVCLRRSNTDIYGYGAWGTAACALVCMYNSYMKCAIPRSRGLFINKDNMGVFMRDCWRLRRMYVRVCTLSCSSVCAQVVTIQTVLPPHCRACLCLAEQRVLAVLLGRRIKTRIHSLKKMHMGVTLGKMLYGLLTA
jgi:hypothetical protein